MACVLGIDGGGTKTVCVLVGQCGQVIGRGESGPSNYQVVGIKAASNSIKNAILQAVTSSTQFFKKTGLINIEGICLGLAGVGRVEDIHIGEELVKELQECTKLGELISLKKIKKAVICNDCAIALVGGIGEPLGIAVIAGTGAIAYGQNRRGETKRTSGWGYILGDEGSGYDIAVRGLRAVVRSHDGRLGKTILTELILQHLGLKNIEDLVEVIYRRGWGVKEIAGLAPIVDKAAANGDAVANMIINQAVEELVLSTQTVIAALFEPDETFEVVTIGGVWRGCVRSRFEMALKSLAPTARVIMPRYEPAYGAALLALRSLSED
ncbi:MAG: ATPase [Oscillatoriaceae bacterium SKW80]|nr:ATPase [Oscillatoriaceae bacterium SKYG93]MCX8121755.1 ATPase [Oscillatoriaceae bacterium SKW80]MDW8453628.1 BadF/BadG/BcrA/BcrD ATPase family protein [Oscillatoriaceae cyanobacterium SKYGB_i_bin93]HIK28693.1 ATPase [Oscillatoriaceae cyanobacterium M7585_C2015_266]